MPKTRIVTFVEKYYDTYDIERAKVAVCKYFDIWLEYNKNVEVLSMSFNDIRHVHNEECGIAEINLIVSEEQWCKSGNSEYNRTEGRMR